MKFNHKMAAVLILTVGTFSVQAQSQENTHKNAIEQIVANLVSNAVNNVSVEIDHQVQKITLTASNLMAFEQSNAPAGTVTITDLAKLDKREDDGKVNTQNDTKDATEE